MFSRISNRLFARFQIRKLERRIVASQLDPTSCVDGYGRVKNNGETWKVHDCKTCECKVQYCLGASEN